MSGYWETIFITKVNSFQESFLKGLIETLKKSGCEYYKEQGKNKKVSGFTSLGIPGEILYGEPLDEVIKKISFYNGGGLQLWLNDLEFFVYFELKKVNREIISKISIPIDRIYLENSSYILGNIFNLFNATYIFTKSIYGYGDLDDVIDEETYWEYGAHTPSLSSILDNNVEYIYHTNFFSPSIVRKLGKEKLLSAPAWKIKELADGGMMIVVCENPLECENEEKERIESHLGLK